MDEMTRLYNEFTNTGTMPSVSQRYIDAVQNMLQDTTTDPALIAKALTMPGIKEFEGYVKPADPMAVNAVTKHLKETLAKDLYNDFKAVFTRTNDGQPYKFDYNSVGNRSMKAIAISYMLKNGSAADITAAKDLYFASDNMTDKMMAVNSITDHQGSEKDAVMSDFLNEFKNDALVIRKYFVAQARANDSNAIQTVENISKQSYFDWENPGHVQFLMAGFTQNYEQFHRADGKGYDFLADMILKVNDINFKTAAGLVGKLSDWRKYAPDTQKRMIEALQKIEAQNAKLGPQVKDKIYKALPDEAESKKLGLKKTPNNPSL